MDVTEGLGGGYLLIWSDFGGWRTEEQVWNGEDDTDGEYNLIDRLWSNSAKMWNWSLNKTLEFERFEETRDSFRLFPGFTECTKEPKLPKPPAAECVPTADHAQLRDLLAAEDAQPIDRPAFSEESAAAYEEAYQNALAVDENYFSTATELTDAVLALQSARQGLTCREEPVAISVTVEGRLITALYPDGFFGEVFIMPVPEFDGYEIDRIEGSAMVSGGLLIGISKEASVTICLKPI